MLTEYLLTTAGIFGIALILVLLVSWAMTDSFWGVLGAIAFLALIVLIFSQGAVR